MRSIYEECQFDVSHNKMSHKFGILVLRAFQGRVYIMNDFAVIISAATVLYLYHYTYIVRGEILQTLFANYVKMNVNKIHFFSYEFAWH